MNEVSTPPWSKAIAEVWRRTWSVTRFPRSDGQFRRATARCLANRYCAPSELRRPPRALGNNTSFVARCGSPSQACKTSTVRFARGVKRSLRPLPRQRSEEHTSELQSRLHLVCRLLLEKKKEK